VETHGRIYNEFNAFCRTCEKINLSMKAYIQTHQTKKNSSNISNEIKLNLEDLMPKKYYTLRIKFLDHAMNSPVAKQILDGYLNRPNYSDDAGIDLFAPESVNLTHTSPPNKPNFVGMGIACEMLDFEGNATHYNLYARSSISKTYCFLANSVGIIDKSYRGEIIAALYCVNPSGYLLNQMDRIVQICAPNMAPIKVEIVNELSESARGAGGFGSTGK
jgi:dUTP pyrophosphatase